MKFIFAVAVVLSQASASPVGTLTRPLLQLPTVLPVIDTCGIAAGVPGPVISTRISSKAQPPLVAEPVGEKEVPLPHCWKRIWKRLLKAISGGFRGRRQIDGILLPGGLAAENGQARPGFAVGAHQYVIERLMSTVIATAGLVVVIHVIEEQIGLAAPA